MKRPTVRFLPLSARAALSSGALVVSLLAADPARATEAQPETKAKPAKAASGSKSSKGKAPEIKLPSFGAIPKGDELKRKEEAQPLPPQATAAPTSATYSVVRIQHAKNFVRSAGGSVPASGAALDAIPLSGSPLMTHRFTTVVRVKSPQKANAPIEVQVLDARGNAAMSAQGEVSFRGSKQDEIDYAIDWDPTPMPRAGTYQLQVSISGQPMGTWPIVIGTKQLEGQQAQ